MSIAVRNYDTDDSHKCMISPAPRTEPASVMNIPGVGCLCTFPSSGVRRGSAVESCISFICRDGPFSSETVNNAVMVPDVLSACSVIQIPHYDASSFAYGPVRYPPALLAPPGWSSDLCHECCKWMTPTPTVPPIKGSFSIIPNPPTFNPLDYHDNFNVKTYCPLEFEGEVVHCLSLFMACCFSSESPFQRGEKNPHITLLGAPGCRLSLCWEIIRCGGTSRPWNISSPVCSLHTELQEERGSSPLRHTLQSAPWVCGVRGHRRGVTRRIACRSGSIWLSSSERLLAGSVMRWKLKYIIGPFFPCRVRASDYWLSLV